MDTAGDDMTVEACEAASEADEDEDEDEEDEEDEKGSGTADAAEEIDDRIADRTSPDDDDDMARVGASVRRRLPAEAVGPMSSSSSGPAPALLLEELLLLGWLLT